MKKIGKVELINATVLNQNEMKNVVGGYKNPANGEICHIHCRGTSGAIEADTCRGAAYVCGDAGIDYCSGTLEKCFSETSGIYDPDFDFEDYYYQR